MSSDLDGEIEGEVTRVEGVRYLQGASGHGVASLLFLAGGCYLLATGEEVIAWTAVTVAALLSANGLSIYAWDELRDRFRSDGTGDDDGPERTLQPHGLSDETQAGLKAGFAMVGLFVVVLYVGYLALQLLDPRSLGYLFVAGLALGNLAAIAWTMYTPREDDDPEPSSGEGGDPASGDPESRR